MGDEEGNMFGEEENDCSRTDSEMEWSENDYPSHRSVDESQG